MRYLDIIRYDHSYKYWPIAFIKHSKYVIVKMKVLQFAINEKFSLQNFQEL